MRLAQAIFLLRLCVTGAVIPCDGEKTCHDFCLSTLDTLSLYLFGMDCPQSPCDIAALAAEALATTSVANSAEFESTRVDALPDFSLCDGFACGDVYACDHSEYDVNDFCYNFDAHREGQVCVSPDGLLIFTKYLEQVYMQASTTCDVESGNEVVVTFSRNVTLMEKRANLKNCQDDANEASLLADVTLLAAGQGQPSSASAHLAVFGSVVAGIFFFFAT